MIYKDIQKKQKHVDPEKFNTRIVEDNSAEADPIQTLAMIMDETKKKETNGPTNEAGIGLKVNSLLAFCKRISVSQFTR
jgi:hypothetical protein